MSIICANCNCRSLWKCSTMTGGFLVWSSVSEQLTASASLRQPWSASCHRGGGPHRPHVSSHSIQGPWGGDHLLHPTAHCAGGDGLLRFFGRQPKSGLSLVSELLQLPIQHQRVVDRAQSRVLANRLDSNCCYCGCGTPSYRTLVAGTWTRSCPVASSPWRPACCTTVRWPLEADKGYKKGRLHQKLSQGEHLGFTQAH